MSKTKVQFLEGCLGFSPYCKLTTLIMSTNSSNAVSYNFAEFLLENADTAEDVLAVLDDVAEVQETAL